MQLNVGTITLPMTTASRTGFSFTLLSLDPTTASTYYSIDRFTGSDPITLTPGSVTLTVTPFLKSAFSQTDYTFTI